VPVLTKPQQKFAGGRRRRWPRILLWAVLVTSAVLVCARVFAPSVVQRSINRRLNRIPGYAGQVDHIHLQIWRGAYELDGVKIVKRDGKVQEPFFKAKEIDFSVAWRELFHRRFVSDIYVEDAHLVFQRGATEATSQLSADRRWQDVIHDIFPIDITHLEIKGGSIRFIDTTREPNVNVAVENVEVLATGLRNRPSDNNEEYPAKIDVSGKSIGEGHLRLFVKLEPLADQPHFESNAELTKVALPALNNFLKAYAGVEVSQGHFELFGQMAMKNGHYEGYVKPFLDHVDFTSPNPKDEDLGRRIWQGLVAAISELFKNGKTKQIGTRIPFSGDTKNFDVGTARAIANGLHQGFIKALPHGFEGTTHPDDKSSKLPPAPPSPGEQTAKAPSS
jgi:uncharacterized protein YhdP